MNNVYIGERYVPKFDGQWDNTKTYEPLIIVTDNGSTYTSKRYVPAGTPITDTNYWILTGSYNGYINQLQSDVADIRTDISNINTDIDSIHSGAKNVIYIGDSFMYGPSTLTVSLNSRLKVANSYNFSHGATGFIRDTDGLNFLHQLQAAAASPYITDRDSITDIIIGGGINDEYSKTETDYTNAIAAIRSFIENNFKNARVWLIPMLWGTSRFTLDDSRKYHKMFNGIIKSGYAVYPYAFQILMGLDPTSYMLDTTHPNAVGCDLIANYIGSWIDGGISLADRDVVNQEILPDGNSNVGYNVILRNGFLYLHCMLYLRDHTYSAGDTIWTLPDWFDVNASTKIPTTILVDAGSYNGAIYIEGGAMKSSDTLVNCNIFVDAIMPLDHLY